jgi:hypothetical protein
MPSERVGKARASRQTSAIDAVHGARMFDSLHHQRFFVVAMNDDIKSGGPICSLAYAIA